MILVLFCRKLPTKAYHIPCDFTSHINHIIRKCIGKIEKYLIGKSEIYLLTFCNTCKLDNLIYNSIMEYHTHVRYYK